MFSNSLLSDVRFIAGMPASESECGLSKSKRSRATVEIPAHKFVLSISSPVFYRMFNGPLAEKSDTIILPDCEYEGLLELFRFMYSDEVFLNRGNVLQVLYLAEKYIMPSLVKECFEYLRENVNGLNVFHVLTHALRCSQQDGELIDRCWEVVDEETELAIQSDGFLTIDRSLLERLVERDSLAVKEIELFKAVDWWASHQCAKQNLGEDGNIKRRIIGEKIVTSIRFPVMEENEFASAVLDSNILKPHEVFEVTRYLYLASPSPKSFLTTKRIGRNKLCERFESVVKFGWHGRLAETDENYKHEMKISVDKTINLQGVRLFGCESEEHSVTLELRDLKTTSLHAKKTSVFASVELQYKSTCFYGIDVLFDEPIALTKDTEYQLTACVSGSCCWRGENALECVECSGVRFTFSPCKKTKEFPVILFTLD